MRKAPWAERAFPCDEVTDKEREKIKTLISRVSILLGE